MNDNKHSDVAAAKTAKQMILKICFQTEGNRLNIYSTFNYVFIFNCWYSLTNPTKIYITYSHSQRGAKESTKQSSFWTWDSYLTKVAYICKEST